MWYIPVLIVLVIFRFGTRAGALGQTVRHTVRVRREGRGVSVLPVDTHPHTVGPLGQLGPYLQLGGHLGTHPGPHIGERLVADPERPPPALPIDGRQLDGCSPLVEFVHSHYDPLPFKQILSLGEFLRSLSLVTDGQQVCMCVCVLVGSLTVTLLSQPMLLTRTCSCWLTTCQA